MSRSVQWAYPRELVVCDHHDRPVFGMELGQVIYRVLSRVGIEVACRLIGQNDLRIVRQCAGQSD